MSATYSSDTYASEAYTTGALLVKHHGPVPVGIFAWARQQQKTDEIEDLQFVTPITVLRDAWHEAPSNITVLQNNVLRFGEDIAILKSNFVLTKYSIQVLDKTVLEILDVINPIEEFEAKGK